MLHDDLVHVIKRAESTRTRFLRENSSSVKKASALAFGLVILFVASFGSSPHQIMENTTLLERLAARLSQMEKIAPGTRAKIAELLRTPAYDCRQVQCDTTLKKRNADVHLHLERVLAQHSIPATLAATK